MFWSILYKTTCSGSAAWQWCTWRERNVLIHPLQNYLLRGHCIPLVSLERAGCSDPSFKNYLLRERYMALISLERARCSDLSFTNYLLSESAGERNVLIRPLQNYLLRERCMALVSLERAHCSDPSFTKLLAQGALHGAGVPGESGMFWSILYKTTFSGSAAWHCLKERNVLIRLLQNYLLRERCICAGVFGESGMFWSVLYKTTCSGSAAWHWCPWRRRRSGTSSGTRWRRWGHPSSGPVDTYATNLWAPGNPKSWFLSF